MPSTAPPPAPAPAPGPAPSPADAAPPAGLPAAAPGLPRRQRRSLRTQLAVGLGLAIGLPFLAVTLVGGLLLAERESLATEQALNNVAVAVARQVDAHLADHLDVVREVATHAEAAGRLDGATLSAALSRVRAIHGDLLSVLATDAEGVIVAVDPPYDAEGRRLLLQSMSVADREYHQAPMRTGEPYVSGVFKGRGLGSDPVVAVSAPVLLDGRRAGVVEASLDVSRIPLLRGLAAPAAFDVIVLDAREQVVFATPGSGYQPLQPLARSALVRAREAAETSLARYQVGGTGYVLAAASIRHGGWHAVIQGRADDVQRGTRRFLLAVLLALAAGLALGLTAAVLLARRATQPLEALHEAVEAFLSGQTPRPLEVPAQAPREVADLVEGYEELQRRVGRTLSGLLPVCTWCHRIRGEGAAWQPLETYVQRHGGAEVEHATCPDCERRIRQGLG